MANTEKLAVLKLIRTAKSAVNRARARRATPPADKDRLAELYTQLDKLEDELILRVLERRVEQVEAASQRLTEVNKELNTKIAELKRVAELVEEAAGAIKLLVDIVVKAATLVG